MTDTDREEESLLDWWDRKTENKTDPFVSKVRALIRKQITIDKQAAENARLNKRVAELEAWKDFASGAWHELQDDYANTGFHMSADGKHTDISNSMTKNVQRKFLDAISDLMMGRAVLKARKHYD